MITSRMFDKFEKQRAYFYTALLYSFSIALDQKFATIALILWAVFSLFNYNKSALNTSKQLLALPILYLTYLLGTIWYGAASYGFLEHKLSLLIFPLIFYLHTYTAQQRKTMLRFFIYGLLLAVICCLVMALNRSLVFDSNGISFVPNVLEGKGFLESIIYGGNHFFGNHFSLFHQTVYFGLYLCAGIAILLFYTDIFSNKARTILTLIFSGVLFLVSNKAAILVLVLIYVLRIFSAKLTAGKKGLILLSFIAITILFAMSNPRIRESLRKLVNMEIGIDKDARFDFSMRILSWDSAISLIKERPVTGFGAGNAQLEFNRKYAEKQYTYPLKEALNAHNQFLQIWIENGLLGLVVLTGIFVALLKTAMRSDSNKGFFIVLLLILFFNALFESVFNRFSGVSFISFLVCFIFSALKRKEVPLEA